MPKAASSTKLNPSLEGKPPAKPPIPCPRSPSGRHEPIQMALVGARDDRRYPPGSDLFLQCRHCHLGGRAFLEDAQVHWDGSFTKEILP